MSADVDDQLRRTVAELAAREDCSWAGIYFAEEHDLVLGPEAGSPDPARRTSVPVLWRDTRVAELAADGSVTQAELEAVAATIGDLCLVGWDTGGELWQSWRSHPSSEGDHPHRHWGLPRTG